MELDQLIISPKQETIMYTVNWTENETNFSVVFNCVENMAQQVLDCYYNRDISNVHVTTVDRDQRFLYDLP